MKRRDFLIGAAGAGVACGLAAAGVETAAAAKEQPMDGKFRKGLILGMLPGGLSVADRFKLARDTGFDGIEIPPVTAAADIAEMRKAVETSGIPVHSIIYGGWAGPLSTPDEAEAAKSLDNLRAALRGAHEVGADGLLLVPAVVSKDVSYRDAYERSHKRIRKVLPLAKELNVRINIEEVWNKFLLSPLEFARYVDEFKSASVGAYFDVANVIEFGWPEHWIEALGKRIAKVHLKDYKRDGRQWVGLGEGDADFPAVMKAFKAAGWSGWMTCELPGGDEKYLRDVSHRVDRIIAGENPLG